MVRKIKVEPGRHPMEAALPYIGQPNPIEHEFRQLAESEGWDVTKRGWPDFICRRNGELMAVEVKGPRDGLSREQYQAISDLRRAGIPTFVWSPDTGFTEVGPPVAESVFTEAADAELRRQRDLARQREWPGLQTNIVQWSFVEGDWDTIAALRARCLNNHATHGSRKQLGTSGSWCSDVAILMRRYSAEEIFAASDLPDLDKVRESMEKIRGFMVSWQHEGLHRQIGVGQRCSLCANAA